jgi:hypothetical protein
VCVRAAAGASYAEGSVSIGSPKARSRLNAAILLGRELAAFVAVALVNQQAVAKSRLTDPL